MGAGRTSGPDRDQCPGGELAQHRQQTARGRAGPARRLVALPPAVRATQRPRSEATSGALPRPDCGLGRRASCGHREVALFEVRDGDRCTRRDMVGDRWITGRRHRGLPGGSSLARLLDEHRPARKVLSLETIRAWARPPRRYWPMAEHAVRSGCRRTRDDMAQHQYGPAQRLPRSPRVVRGWGASSRARATPPDPTTAAP